MGTLELEAGNRRFARKFFKLSLEDPTDNSVAQAEWADERDKLSLVSADALKLPGTFEARSKFHFREGKFREAVRDAWTWLRDEPFSREPAVWGSYVASSATEDHGEAAAMLNVALIANPTDVVLLNNLAFCYATTGDLTKAKDYLARAKANVPDDRQGSVLAATSGLIKFREGDFEKGRELYNVAVDFFRSRGAKRLAAMAALMLAREEKLARLPVFYTTLEMARELSKGLEEPEVRLWLERLER